MLAGASMLLGVALVAVGLSLPARTPSSTVGPSRPGPAARAAAAPLGPARGPGGVPSTADPAGGPALPPSAALPPAAVPQAPAPVAVPPAPAPPQPAPPPPGAAPAPVRSVGAVPASRPLVVQIPRIGVDSEIVDLALNRDRTLQVPDFGSAGWYVHAPTPGEVGPAIVAAHVSSRRGPDVFARLAELVPGDEVRVRRQDGTTAVFRVDGIERVPKDAFPTDRVYGDIGHAGLRLITCGGGFNRSTGHFRDNVIVYASLVGAA